MRRVSMQFGMAGRQTDLHDEVRAKGSNAGNANTGLCCAVRSANSYKYPC